MGEPIAIFVLLKFSSLNTELGFQCDKNQGECHAKFSCHLDYFAWVKRDSYLPHESQGLKVHFFLSELRIHNSLIKYCFYFSFS
ncbi:hypothetical protein ACS0TY_028086 [Phlomoides rotata]